MPCVWDGNRRSGVALGHASQTLVVHTGSKPIGEGDEHHPPTFSSVVYGELLPFLL